MERPSGPGESDAGASGWRRLTNGTRSVLPGRPEVEGERRLRGDVDRFDGMAAGSVAEARAKGKARMEGKDYVMQDGDVVEFRFNV